MPSLTCLFNLSFLSHTHNAHILTHSSAPYVQCDLCCPVVLVVNCAILRPFHFNIRNLFDYFSVQNIVVLEYTLFFHPCMITYSN